VTPKWVVSRTPRIRYLGIQGAVEPNGRCTARNGAPKGVQKQVQNRVQMGPSWVPTQDTPNTPNPRIRDIHLFCTVTPAQPDPGPEGSGGHPQKGSKRGPIWGPGVPIWGPEGPDPRGQGPDLRGYGQIWGQSRGPDPRNGSIWGPNETLPRGWSRAQRGGPAGQHTHRNT
jgi:hypothetical protein